MLSFLFLRSYVQFFDCDGFWDITGPKFNINVTFLVFWSTDNKFEHENSTGIYLDLANESFSSGTNWVKFSYLNWVNVSD